MPLYLRTANSYDGKGSHRIFIPYFQLLIQIIRWKYAPDYLTVEKLLENDIVTGAEPIEEVEVKWDSTELVLFDSLSPYCEASVKVFLSLQKTSCIIKTYLYQKDEVSLIIHSIQ